MGESGRSLFDTGLFDPIGGLVIALLWDALHWGMTRASLALALDNAFGLFLLLASVALLHLFLAFPTPHPQLSRLRRMSLGPVFGWPAARLPAMALLYAVPLAVPTLELVATGTSFTSFPVSMIAVLATIGALISGYRRVPGPAARAQLNWILLAVAVFMIVLLVAVLVPTTTAGRVRLLPPAALTATLVLFPVCIGVAILRYGLFDIDILINRTTLYGTMTVILGSIFLVGSTLSQGALEAATGQRSDLVTMGTALAVAAGFQPLRRRAKPVVDRFLPARQVLVLLFTDIVGSTERVVELGDERWREMLETYRVTVRRELKRFGGHEVDAAGDGFFATFHSPMPAARCGQAIATAGRELGLNTRVGLHCGECEMRGEKVSGVNVHVAARVMALAGPGEVVVSGVLREWLPEAELTFGERGVHSLRGVPGDWQLYSLAEV